MSGALLLSAFACADRLINIPVGYKVPFHQARLEYLYIPDHPTEENLLLDVGLTPDVEVGVHEFKTTGKPAVGTLDLTYTYTAPFTDVAPGFSVGVRDIMDKTPDRTRAFAVMTLSMGAETEVNPNVPMEITLGGMFIHHWSPIVGIMLPITPEFRLLAEHDGIRINSAVEIKPKRWLGFRMGVWDSKAMLSAQIETHW